MKLSIELLRSLVREQVTSMMTSSEEEEKVSNLLSQVSGLSKKDAIKALTPWGARFHFHHSGYNREVVGSR